MQRRNVVLNDYGMSFVINSGIWLVSLDCLNTLIMMKPVAENVAADVRRHERLPHGTGGRNDKDDMSHSRKSPCEIHAFSSLWTGLITCLKPCAIFQTNA